MEYFSAITAIGENNFPAAAIIMAVFTRISALVFFLPGLAERTIPVRIRLTVAMAVTLIIIPVIGTNMPPPPSPSQAALMIAAEGVAGMLIGFTIRIAIFALQTAGAIASQSLSLSQLFGATIDFQPEPPIATLFMMAGIVLAVSSGLHVEAIRVLIISYDIMPLGVFPGVSDTGQWAAEQAAFAFSIALSLALPFVLVGFIYNLAIGAANRAMPQLMVAFVGAPAITFAGLVLLAITSPVVLTVWMDVLQDNINTPLERAQ